MPSRSGRGQKRDPQKPADAGRGASPTAVPATDGEHDAPVPRDFGRDGISGLLTPDRALRAREVSRPGRDDDAATRAEAEAMLRRLGPRSRR